MPQNVDAFFATQIFEGNLECFALFDGIASRRIDGFEDSRNSRRLNAFANELFEDGDRSRMTRIFFEDFVVNANCTFEIRQMVAFNFCQFERRIETIFGRSGDIAFFFEDIGELCPILRNIVDGFEAADGIDVVFVDRKDFEVGNLGHIGVVELIDEDLCTFECKRHDAVGIGREFELAIDDF